MIPILTTKEVTLVLPTGLIRVKTVDDLLPVCAWCNQVRDAQTRWHPLDLSQLTWLKGLITHTICPACGESLKD